MSCKTGNVRGEFAGPHEQTSTYCYSDLKPDFPDCPTKQPRAGWMTMGGYAPSGLDSGLTALSNIGASQKRRDQCRLSGLSNRSPNDWEEGAKRTYRASALADRIFKIDQSIPIAPCFAIPQFARCILHAPPVRAPRRTYQAISTRLR